VFVLLRAQTGHDFSQYKPNTLRRRVARRMALQELDTIDEYVRHLRQSPTEVDVLFRDLLIGVTNFFRDPKAFKALETEVLPKLVARKPPGSTIRVWTPGCATGEEAYSIAMLLQEQMEAQRKKLKVQIFATDIDARAIESARSGRFRASIRADLTPERLKRFFTSEPDSSDFRVIKSLREMLVFSEHDVIRDPPFSKLDLISCRNLLIYMGPELQKKLIPLFHYALNPEGVLFLGVSETIGEFGQLFSVVDRKAKLYRRKEALQGAPGTLLSRFLPRHPAAYDESGPSPTRAMPAAKVRVRELTEQALLQAAPAAALVSGRGDILYLHGRTGKFLEPAPGEAGVNNILKMARKGLQRELARTMQTAASQKTTVVKRGVRVKTNGEFTGVHLTVRPLSAAPFAHEQEESAGAEEPLLYLVLLEEAELAEAGEVERAPVGGSGEGQAGLRAEGRG
jgi:two-component system, chemotaxis family, CheB/CheR fusion protein